MLKSLKNYNIIDQNIREVIIELNRKGYETHDSCAGNHKNVPTYEYDPRGYIGFVGTLDATKLKEVLKSLGLKRIKVYYGTYWRSEVGTYPDTIVQFTGLGGPSSNFG